jgi:hypothetical protein
VTLSLNKTGLFNNLVLTKPEIIQVVELGLHKSKMKIHQIVILLQNWGRQKAYVEVDVDFLASSWATVRFITKKQTRMGDYHVNVNALVECDLDVCEKSLPEGYHHSKGHEE